ncbi:TIGR02587 family membrane protein [Luteolibacter luteus]|nr:TIGR02587 family membrane protein [Luteolibacter luteus]
MNFSHSRSIPQSAREYGRGIAGGLMFSLPLLYTMEVWWTGFVLHPGRILLYILATFILLILYNRFAGLRRDASIVEVAIDSVEEMGIGVVIAAAILWITGRIDSGMDLSEISGKITMEAMTVAIGVSVGTAQLGADDDGDEGLSGDDGRGSEGYLPQAAIALCGAVLFAANVAPTEEIQVIAMESRPGNLLLLALCSLALGGLVLHFAEIQGHHLHVARDSFLASARGVITTYAVALTAGAACLFFFGQFDGQPLRMILAQTIVIGVPAVLGASAGRLLLQVRPPGA